MIEKEFKILLSKNQYERINSYYQFSSPVEQINYYFDTPDFQLDKQGITLRIRKIQFKPLLLQLKKKEKGIYDYSKKLEVEKIVDFIPQKMKLEYLSELLIEDLPSEIKSVDLIGELKTIRREYSSEDITLCLDKNVYHNKEDYELELEFDGSEQETRNIISNLNLQIPKKVIGKYKRFINEYKKKENIIEEKN